jgi:hypothetical protein
MGMATPQKGGRDDGAGASGDLDTLVDRANKKGGFTLALEKTEKQVHTNPYTSSAERTYVKSRFFVHQRHH